MASVLVNGSPKLPRLSMPSALDHESFDITLHRKDTEGFGFVILTSKSKPPPGGETQLSEVLRQCRKIFLYSQSQHKWKTVCVSVFPVIPHKIGRIIEGSPTDRCGLLHVGDRISAVNGCSIIELSHNDIVQLIKDAGSVVTLTVVPEDGELFCACGSVWFISQTVFSRVESFVATLIEAIRNRYATVML